ncbi:hypothetical protein MesoLj131c_47170 [Mesorhizobium sp. 131-3-5]|uniref:hypothetical protein n=1 Tax=Mesorhizobium sp. 131-3-5 TaxID=2744520 RepID=UPI001926EDCA|nr:hypothetical protein [Mesorhizobium sp. 131-3-5]BCH10459.1 hypothetical protein MesoLj131c_47170 [Mesorhizobium sp. 131-3-5]
MHGLDELQQGSLHVLGRSIGCLELAVYPELQQRHFGRQIQTAVGMLLGVEVSDQHGRETSALAVGSDATPAGGELGCLPINPRPVTDPKFARWQIEILKGLLP